MTKERIKKICTQSTKTIAIALLFFVIGVGVQKYAPIASGLSQTQAREDLSLFWRVWNLMERKYTFEEPDVDTRIYAAIEGLVRSYDDDYTTFFSPSETEFFAETIAGEFGGIGVEVAIRDGFLTVVAPLEDSPAQEAGVRAEDIITAIDGTDVIGLSFNQAINMIRGDVGTEVTLSIIRQGNQGERIISITREIVEIPILETDIRGDIFIVSLFNFNQGSAELFEEAMKEFRRSRKSKLLLDLRNNPGGLLDASIDVTSYFVDQGKTVVEEEFGLDDRASKMYRSSGYDTLNNRDFEMMVLINSGSASASEIVAGALQDYEIATIAGTTTFGKGSVQEWINLPENTSLKVTTARWLTPKGNHISDIGIEPDIVIEEDDIDTDEDEQLEEALELFRKM